MSQEAINQQNQESPEQKNSKIEKRFNRNMDKLMALFAGDHSIFKTKVPNNNVSSLVEELLKERREEAGKQFKAKAISLLDKKVEFDKLVSQKKKEFEDSVNKGREEFSKEMEACFQLVENIDILAGDYAKYLGQVGRTPVEEAVDNSNKETTA
jgi:Rps23 Pro-64 3,4-dihydroxylase Tpa1-like proline 4-hydroxylase